MATNFPGSVDSFTNPTSGDTLDSPSHAAQHTNVNDAVEAIETHLLDGYLYRQTVYFTSSGTFTKATYPWLRAVRVKCQGAGGGGGGAEITAAGERSAGAGGGGGAYAESFITDIGSLSASETVTVGAGGAGGTGFQAGTGGGTTSFGSLVSADGGGGGNSAQASSSAGLAAGGIQGVSATGDLEVSGAAGGFGVRLFSGSTVGGRGGTSQLGGVSREIITTTGADGSATSNRFGSGGGGAANNESQGTARTGGVGADGIVIVELFA